MSPSSSSSLLSCSATPTRAFLLAFFLTLLTSLLVAAPAIRAQALDQPVPGYVMKRWTTADGLPHDGISAILQTRDGYLWIGTANAGLARFDGMTFKAFNILNTPGLPSDNIRALHEDDDGTLWVGTAAGLARSRDGVFTSERLGDDASHNLIVDIRADHEGRLWVATQGQVLRRDDGEWTVVPIDGMASGLSPSPDGAMWIATSVGLIEWRDRVVRTLTMREGLPSDFVAAVHEDRGGRVWIGTNRGLAHLEPHGERVLVERSVSPSTEIHTIFEDSRDMLWIGAQGRLFARAADGTHIESELANGPDAEPLGVHAFAEDREGHVWFGTLAENGGLHRLAQARVSTLSHEAGLPCNNIGAITQGADGTLWIATLCVGGRGLVAIRDGKLTEYPGVSYVESLLAEPDGVVWVGTFEGRLFQFAGNRFEEVRSPTREGRTVEDSIAVLYRHDDGALWLGTSRGLLRFHDGEWARLRSSDGLVSDDVRSIVRGRDGSMWIGTGAGISRYHDGRFTSYRTADGVPPGPVRAIHVDADGVVWIGTYGGGLARLKDGIFTSYGVRGGVLDSSVHRILEDEDGLLWLTGDRGIRRASKRDLNAIADGHADFLTARLFDERDGMRSAECNGMAQPAGWRTRDGIFHFPTQRGVVRVDPVRIAQSTLPPPVPHIEDAIVDGVAVPTSPEAIAPAGYGEIEIHYTAPTFVRPEYAQFRYRLEGHDRDWVDVGTRRSATYTNLEPGRYRFLVSARRTGGPWQEQPATVAVVLQPYFYQRVPFQIVALLLLITSGAAAGRWYVNGLHRRAEELERAVAERTYDLSIAHQSLLTAKHTVQQAHDQVLAVLNQLDIAVVVLSAAGVVRHASESAQRLLDKDAQTLVGRPWSLALPLVEADRAQIKARIETLSRSEGRVPVQMVIGGKRYWMEIDVRDEPPPGDGRILYIYSATEVSTLPSSSATDGLHGLVGRSTAMHLVYKQIRDVARVDATVLIEGETGAGKELVARAIHRGSRRADKPFVAINAAGLSESLLASQLFGHRRGAFTGAVDDQMGVFEAADGGTLFLDEIGDMPLSVQSSLLRVLQEREITRIGESRARRIGARFLAATHRDLTREVAEGRFREDLLYRIRVATIVVPPLRDRLDDVPLLVDAFLTQAARHEGRPTPQMSRSAIEALLRHRWPGNVRQLKAVIEQSLVNAPGELIRLEDLPPDIVVGGREPAAAPNGIPPALEERERLVQALRRTGGNRSEAAKLLGIGRTTLYRRLAAHGLDIDTDE